MPPGYGVFNCRGKERMRKRTRTARKENTITRYFRETNSELKKVVWPNRQETLNLTVIVIAVTLVMSASLGLMDFIFSRLFELIIR
ncbi:MAG: preprotein translocase subunit SecE [Anaerolineae bacterium]